MITEALLLSAILFVIGTFGVLVRRNAIIIFLAIELQLNAVNVALVAFSNLHGIDGQIFVFFVMTVAAAEAAVGLAIIISIFRHYETVDVNNFNFLKW
ncbi:MAG: NADH-quinone oxidoreductase subunit NuoK [Gemmatimonadota bacterium]|nr:NADH-quinone oxidoreductase subunit NuoK [Gemmatimonadota bacterium]|tara:strand:+ start:3863 stop:4156 length:294 start_codon:yes stop_codon:yes gene_type:complete